MHIQPTGFTYAAWIYVALPASHIGENVGASGVKSYRPTVMLVAVIIINKISFRKE
jgi:hypothetical protein